jgi:glycosyltransferase involved in cell wall biosynthesis
MKLSIITVNKNNAQGLEKTIESVVCQKFTNYEYIIIDGNSTDNSVDIIKKYSDSIHYWISEPDTGIYNAMNKGIRKATGEYVIFMNSGDCFINSDTLLNVFSKEHTADLLVGSMIREWKSYYKEKTTIASKITFYAIVTSPIPHQSTFTKRSLFDDLGFYDERFKTCADRKFFILAVFKYDKSIEKLDEDIAVMDTTGISNSGIYRPSMKKEADEILRECFPYLYEDYKKLYRLRRFTISGLKRHIKWRFREFLRQW